MGDTKRFEEWEQVDCNECARYWDSSCDAVSKEQRRACTSYLATRSVVIPAQIKSLQETVKWVRWSCMLTTIALILHLLSHIFGW